MSTTVEACVTYLIVHVLWEIALVPLEQVIDALKDLVVGGVPHDCEDVLECAWGELWKTGTVLMGFTMFRILCGIYNIAHRYIIHYVLFLSLVMRYFRASGICSLRQSC
jgi:hypothetical protein